MNIQDTIKWLEARLSDCVRDVEILEDTIRYLKENKYLRKISPKDEELDEFLKECEKTDKELERLI